MKKRAHIPLHRLGDRQRAGMELHFIAAGGDEQPGILLPHRDDHYIFGFQQTGFTRFMIDFEVIEIAEQQLFYILPGQVHHPIALENPGGWFLAIETALVPEQYRQIFEEGILRQEPLKVTDPEYAALDAIARVLYDLLQEPEGCLPSVLFSLSSSFIGMVAGAYHRKHQPGQRLKRPAAVAHRFRSLLRRHFLEEKSPAGYANRMNLSLSYLNECVRSETGMPVSSWIRQEILIEAKRMLFYSDLSVKEIAFYLGFEDHAYFSRLFTNAAGMSPGSFRRFSRE